MQDPILYSLKNNKDENNIIFEMQPLLPNYQVQ